MKPLPLIVACIVASAAAGAVTSLALRPDTAEAAAPASLERDGLAELRARVDEVGASVARLASRVDELGPRPAAGDGGRVPVGDIEAAVRRYMDEHAAGLAGAGSASGKEAAAAASHEATAPLQDLVAEIMDPSLPDEERQALWEEVREAGRLDELVDWFESYAAGRPNDPDAQVLAGNAYLQKIFEAGSDGPQAGIWANRADKAFDRALEVDPDHWEARFTKAISLSFWPPIFGKQAEAVRQFETLIEKQAAQPAREEFAQSYLLLGNLYLQKGDAAKAQATWQKGLELYPDAASLKAKLEQEQEQE